MSDRNDPRTGEPESLTKLGKTEVRMWRAPELGAELLRGDFLDFSYDPHTHDTACFALITQGAIRIRMRGTEFVARQGDLYAIEADEPHAGWPVDEQGWRQRTLYVPTHHLRALVREDGLGSAALLKASIIADTRLTRLLQAVHFGSESHGDALYREEQYLLFADRLFTHHVRAPSANDRGGPEPRAIRVAREFLDGHLDENVHLDAIADAAGLPVFRLFRAFERYVGMTPHTYQRQARIRTASTLIRLGHPLSEVAAMTGFADQAHLTRLFRRSMGVTPGAFRKAVLS